MFAHVFPRSRLIRDSALGLAVMIVGVVVFAVILAPLPLGAIWGLMGALYVSGWIQRYRRSRKQR